MTYFGSGNDYSGLDIPAWQIALCLGLMIIGAGTIAYWVIGFLCAHLRWTY